MFCIIVWSLWRWEVGECFWEVGQELSVQIKLEWKSWARWSLWISSSSKYSVVLWLPAFRDLRAFEVFRLAEKQFKSSEKRVKPSRSGNLGKFAGLISIMMYLKICPACREQRDWAFSLEGVLESCDSLGHASAFFPPLQWFQSRDWWAPLP